MNCNVPRSTIHRFLDGPRLSLVCGLVAIMMLAASPVLAKGNGKGGGKGGGGGNGGGGNGGGGSAYTIVDLPGPHHDANGGTSATTALQAADVSAAGPVYVLGAYGSTFNSPCLWTVSSEGSVSAIDLVGLIDYAHDINSAGIIAGQHGNRPMLLLADGTPVFLADPSISGVVMGVNNPDESGVFQAVGSMGPWPGVLWDVDLDGNILSEVVLSDANSWHLMAHDISDSQFLGGRVVGGTPAVGVFDEVGELQIGLLALPGGIDGVWDYGIDDAGNLLGNGYQWSIELGGYIPHAVIWPVGGGAINLTTLTEMERCEGNGIALVAGAMQVVGRGRGSRGDSFAYLFANGTLSDLGSLSEGDQSWRTLQTAEGVNTSGMICGQGRVGSKKHFQIHGYLLVPNAP